MAQFSDLRSVLADVLAPRVCLGCRAEGSWLCAACVEAVERDPNVACVGCGRPSRFGATCALCRRTFPLQSVVALASYRDAVVQQLVQTVKYASAHDAADAFATLIRDGFDRTAVAEFRAEVGSSPLLVPVPLHRRRLAERGFNQSACIAGAVAAMGWGTVVPPEAFVRRKCSLPQATSGPVQRFTNVEDVFTCAAPAAIAGRPLVLVDDVVTTGATLAACARELRRVSAGPVWGFALARG
ncbi:ComF family protein [Candidatus Uhrbacteria bacterium]|nr:ComF family protein [Candidatus Uhrbacteria bacterium]